MDNERESVELIKKICQINSIGEVHSCVKQNIGFNRLVYIVNEKFVIKICINPYKENGIKNEIQYYETNSNFFNPTLIDYDVTKQIIPYIYTVEEKIAGENLFSIWGNLSESQREEILIQLIEILKILHKPIAEDFNLKRVNDLLDKYNFYLKRLNEADLISQEKINYLRFLSTQIAGYFEDAKFGYIHGDIHFNNLIYSNGELKLIDYECYDIGPLDKEFDSINRMVRNPNSLIKMGFQEQVNPIDYIKIMPFLREKYSESCCADNFEERLLIYDCINSMKWICTFPKHKRYLDVLFEDSKKLIKKR